MSNKTALISKTNKDKILELNDLAGHDKNKIEFVKANMKHIRYLLGNGVTYKILTTHLKSIYQIEFNRNELMKLFKYYDKKTKDRTIDKEKVVVKNADTAEFDFNRKIVQTEPAHQSFLSR